MTKFAPIELCQKLVELGCKSESNFFWVQGDGTPFPMYNGAIPMGYKVICEALTQNDFTGCHEQARKNARLIWGDARIDNNNHDRFHLGGEHHRHIMIDSEDWVKYLQDALAKTALTELTKIAQENDMGY